MCPEPGTFHSGYEACRPLPSQAVTTEAWQAYCPPPHWVVFAVGGVPGRTQTPAFGFGLRPCEQDASPTSCVRGLCPWENSLAGLFAEKGCRLGEPLRTRTAVPACKLSLRTDPAQAWERLQRQGLGSPVQLDWEEILSLPPSGKNNPGNSSRLRITFATFALLLVSAYL